MTGFASNWGRYEVPTTPNGAEWRIKQLEEDITRLKKDMWYGNGKPGMTTRMEKVEEAVASMKYYFRAIMLILIGLLAHAFWDIITKR